MNFNLLTDTRLTDTFRSNYLYRLQIDLLVQIISTFVDHRNVIKQLNGQFPKPCYELSEGLKDLCVKCESLEAFTLPMNNYLKKEISCQRKSNDTQESSVHEMGQTYF